MAYPESGAGYKNRPAWLDRAVAAENAPASDAASRALKGAMDAQGREALDISDAVPRRDMRRADGGTMDNAKMAQVDRDFEPAAAQDARDAAATRVASRSMRRANVPMGRITDPSKPGLKGGGRT